MTTLEGTKGLVTAALGPGSPYERGAGLSEDRAVAVSRGFTTASISTLLYS